MSLAQKINRVVAPFEVVSEFQPAGDQPKAIAELSERIQGGEKDVVLMGATGTGKSATAAWLIEAVQRPTLLLVQNKTLAAQLANELRELLPNNAVEYFVSYYDYYQPEAYVPQTDTFIEKDSSINEEVERLRHSATNALLTRRDTVVVSTVSCIYGLGTPEEYVKQMVTLAVGQEMDRDALLRQFVNMQYVRNDVDFHRGTFRVRGTPWRSSPCTRRTPCASSSSGTRSRPSTPCTRSPGRSSTRSRRCTCSPPPTTWPVRNGWPRPSSPSRTSCRSGCRSSSPKQAQEAQRLRMRTQYDLEMMEQMGYCNGIENYSLHIDGRPRGSAPHCLLDYFPDDFLLIIDESHVTVPQIGGMYEGDMSRKRTLVDHGFRLPSAMDNRPLKWDEFLERIGQTMYMSATPVRTRCPRWTRWWSRSSAPRGWWTRRWS